MEEKPKEENRGIEGSQWSYGSKMESFTEEELKERIKKAMEYEIPNKIRPIPFMGNERELIRYRYSELIARCPVTGISDMYDILIDFIPSNTIPELKSLKIYFWAYQQLPISHEHLAAKVYNDFTKTINPKECKLTLLVSERGELRTSVVLGKISLQNGEGFDREYIKPYQW